MSPEETVHRIGDYEILGVLGAGGMGKVFKVRNVISDRIEAMKILLPDLAGQKELADRFLREIKLLASLNHPNIASLRTALTLGNQLVMIMEFVEGTTLAARVEQGPIPPADAVDYIDQVLVALSYAHRQHVIHRDIKPANMMLTPQGLVKLMDFGIARSGQDRGTTMTGTTLGSLYYMSPEQVKGEGVDARSDLYSVAVSLYELVTGRKPFQADSNYSLMSAHLQQAPTPPIELQPSLPFTLNEVILMGLAKDPAQRFQSADAFRNALKNVAEGLRKRSDVAVAPVSPPPAVGATAVFQDHLPPRSAASPVAEPAAAPVQPSVQAQAEAPVPAAIGTPPSTISGTAPAVAQPGPQGVPQPLPDSAKPGGYRGFYMTLGALVVLAVLVAAGVYVPRWEKARASGQASQSTQQPASPATSAPASPANAGGDGSQPPTNSGSSATATATSSQQPAANAVESQPSTPPSSSDSNSASAANAPSGDSGHGQAKATATENSGQHHPSNSPSQGRSSGNQVQASEQPSTPSSAGSTQSGQSQAGVQQAGGAGSQATAADSAVMDELEHQMDQLTSRAAAAKDSVETIRREQSQQGLNLRGDISAAEQRMDTYMGKAQSAFQNQDAKSTKRYLDLAEPEIETLEKFLGRR
ncbi:MAG TPA: protein kinase [Terriglobia bacterium]|nr:protein kinase [Terriglobia bacterium]